MILYHKTLSHNYWNYNLSLPASRCHSSEFENFPKNNELFLTCNTVSNEGEKIPTLFPCISQLSSTRVNMIDRALTKMIIIDNEALRLVEWLGFQQYTAALNASYKIADRRTISQHLLRNRIGSEGHNKEVEQGRFTIIMCWHVVF